MDWSDLIGKTLDGYIQIETARQGNGLAQTLPDQRYLSAPALPNNPQAGAQSMPVVGGISSKQLVIGAAVVGALALAYKLLR